MRTHTWPNQRCDEEGDESVQTSQTSLDQNGLWPVSSTLGSACSLIFLETEVVAVFPRL